MKFVEKKKRNPSSRNPAQNTKGYSKGGKLGKTKARIKKDEFRGSARDVEAKPAPNKADAWLEQAQQPRERNRMDSGDYGTYEEREEN